jgi:ABC-type glutathione transport system ATPase component
MDSAMSDANLNGATNGSVGSTSAAPTNGTAVADVDLVTNQPGEALLLQVDNLKKFFPITKGIFRSKIGEVRAVDDVSFAIRERETLALVGESGCGKTTTGRSVIRAI